MFIGNLIVDILSLLRITKKCETDTMVLNLYFLGKKKKFGRHQIAINSY